MNLDQLIDANLQLDKMDTLEEPRLVHCSPQEADMLQQEAVLRLKGVSYGTIRQWDQPIKTVMGFTVISDGRPLASQMETIEFYGHKFQYKMPVVNHT